MAEEVLRFDSVSKEFNIRRSVLLGSSRSKPADFVTKAVDKVSFSIRNGETFGLVGESGSGKSTIARLAMKLLNPTSGSIHYQGVEISKISDSKFKRFRREMHLVYQNPFSSLDPRMNVQAIIEEPMRIHHSLKKKSERTERVAQLLKAVGLENLVGRNVYPHQLSGGQRQRVAIARALSLSPRFIIADEPTAALDVSTQASIMQLLNDLKKNYNLTMLLISHDLGVIRYMCDRIAVMYLGKIVELGNTEDLFVNPRHPYTLALLSSIPVPDPKKRYLLERITSSVNTIPSESRGCRYYSRCQFAREQCNQQQPEMIEIANGHFAACFGANDKTWIPNSPAKVSAL